MALRWASTERAERNVRLFVAMLARCPELGSLHYDPRLGRARYAFFIRRGLPLSSLAALRERIATSVDALLQLEGRPLNYLRIDWQDHGEVTVLEVERDASTLTPDEIALVVELVREGCGDHLVSDRAPGEEEDSSAQEELLEELLDDLGQARGDHRLIAYREDGRVMIFNA